MGGELTKAILAVILFLGLLFVPATASTAQQAQNQARRNGVGQIAKNLSDKKMISFDDDLLLDIGPAIIARGDRLKIVPETAGSNAMGWLVVTSRDGEPARGKVRGAAREIPADSYLEFVLADDEQVNVFLPFIKSLADAFIDDPLSGPLRVAVIDVINPYGERTQAGDAMFETLSRHICGRPQFECVKREKIVEEMWRLRIPTSRGIGANAEKALKKALGAAVILTGHLRLSDAGVAEFILLARTLDGPELGGDVWRKFEAPPEIFGITGAAFGHVTVKFTDVPPGLLRFRVADSPELDGMMADHVGSAELGGWITGHDGDVAAEPSGHFVFVDGESLVMAPDGRFREQPVAAGERRVRIGYYPQAVGSGVSPARPNTPVEKSFDIHVEPGETVEITILGGITGTRGVIAADLRRVNVN
jgi:hypothetical protein